MSEPDFEITGGAGGVGARYDDIGLLAEHSEEVSGDLAAISAGAHAIVADPDLLASAALNPDGFARVETGLLAALDGPEGLSGLAFGFAQRSMALRTTVATYQFIDEERARTIDTLRWAAGFAIGVSALEIGSLGIGPTALALALFGDDIDWQRLITEHPGLVDTLVGMGPGLLTSLPGTPFLADVPEAAALIGDFYDDGDFQVQPISEEDLNDDTSEESLLLRKPPRNIGDLLLGLNYRNEQASSPMPGQIDVRIITHPDGTKAYIVDIPGTKEMNMPWDPETSNLNDMGTNIHVLAGDVTSRQRAIAEALRMAGAGPNDPVMLVGHSQGGMVAAQAAHDSGTSDFPYNVTHVVTAGSPIGRTEIPEHIQVLSLENRHDIVPHLDAADNPDRANRTTVVFDSQQGSISKNHSIGDAYLPAAKALDNSKDSSVQAYRDSAGAFFNGESVEPKVYDLTRTFNGGSGVTGD